ncbi:MAG: hypothetical protein R3277_12195 [Brumimicrobium sp.]|nr:hypothetical protein [Brumimicrobium sp.]
MFRNTLLLAFFVLFVTKIVSSQTTVSLVNVPSEIFVNNGKTDFEKILFTDGDLQKDVALLYKKKLLSHDFTDPNSSFEQYWEIMGDQWFRVTLKPGEKPLILFKGMASFSDEKSYVELYDLKRQGNERVYTDYGNLLAYQVHPFTSEIILFIHKYPCCRSASHNIIKVRYLKMDAVVKDKFFVGRDAGDMVGPFYPEKVEFSGEYHQLQERKLLRWSPEIVQKNAFLGFSETNAIIHYEKGAYYKILGEKEDWYFVLMLNGIAEEQSMVINHLNFKNRPVYGWIKK